MGNNFVVDRSDQFSVKFTTADSHLENITDVTSRMNTPAQWTVLTMRRTREFVCDSPSYIPVNKLSPLITYFDTYAKIHND